MPPVTAERDELDRSRARRSRHLASFERPSASDGERAAADWIAARLRAEGCSARVEEERAHGDLLVAARPARGRGRARGARPRRGAPGAAPGTFAAAAIADDVSGGRLWFRRAALPQRPTFNVVAQAGDDDAERTVVFVAHHDAAHWSLLFAPQIPEWFGDPLPGAAGALRHDSAADVPGRRRPAARRARRR